MKTFLWIIGGAVAICATLGIVYVIAVSRIH
jgi:hypothetical protein